LNICNVGIYLDFENLVISSEYVYPSRERPLSLRPIVDFAASRGDICVKKAYANWQNSQFNRYQKTLTTYGFEAIHLPNSSSQGKNGADVRLVVDVMECLEQLKHIDTFVIGSGDTDFIPLLQKIRQRGKKVVVVGFDHSVGSLVKQNCTEFKSLVELLDQSELDSLEDSENVSDSSSSRELLVDTCGRETMIRFIKSSKEDSILMGNLKLNLKKIDPSFSEKKLGYSSFKKYVESLQGDLIERIEHNNGGNPIVYFVEACSVQSEATDNFNGIEEYLKNLRYQRDSKIRLKMSQIIFKYYKNGSEHSMNDTTEYLYSKINSNYISKKDVQKFIYTLFKGKVLFYSRNCAEGALTSRPLKIDDNINGYIEIEKRYRAQMKDLINNKFLYVDINKIDALLNREVATQKML